MALIQVQKGYSISFTSTVDAGYNQKYQINRKLVGEGNNIQLGEISGGHGVSYNSIAQNSFYEVHAFYDHDWVWHRSAERNSSSNDGLTVIIATNDSGNDDDYNDLVIKAVIQKDPNYTGPFDPNFQNGLIT